MYWRIMDPHVFSFKMHKVLFGVRPEPRTRFKRTSTSRQVDVPDPRLVVGRQPASRTHAYTAQQPHLHHKHGPQHTTHVQHVCDRLRCIPRMQQHMQHATVQESRMPKSRMPKDIL